MGPMHWIHGWGLAYGIYPWGSSLVMGKFDGETFLGGLLIFFLGGWGGKRKRQVTVSRVGRWTTHVFKQPHFVLYYICIIYYILYFSFLFSSGFVFSPPSLKIEVPHILKQLTREEERHTSVEGNSD